jgi:biopolymer transport protein ExbD
MGFGGGGGKGVRSDINVTPLVDVVLVLLIIFIVATPMMLHELTLEIPRKAEPQPDQPTDSQVIVQMTFDGVIKVGEQPVSKFELSAKVADLLKNKTQKIVFIGFDDAVKYGEAVSVVDLVKGAGPPDGPGSIKIALKMKDELKPGEAPPGGAPPATP